MPKPTHTCMLASWRGKLSLVAALVLSLFLVIPLPAAADDGFASWYGEPFHGRRMYSGPVFDMYDPTTTAANMWPIGTWLKVTNPANGRSVVVQVRDRGLFKHAFDLSYGAFKALDDPSKMMIPVHYEIVTGPDGGAPAAAPSPAPSPAPPAVPPPPPPPPAAPTTPPESYVVVRGDSLISVARKFGLDYRLLARWNVLDNPDRLKAGQRLTLRSPEVAVPVPSSRGEDASPSPSPTGGDTYTVAPGDTMWALATKYNTSPEQLAQMNGLGDANAIAIGQQLRVPGGHGEQLVQAAAPELVSPRHYVVQAGDTLLGIALGGGTSLAAVVQANSIVDDNFLQVGQVLILP